MGTYQERQLQGWEWGGWAANRGIGGQHLLEFTPPWCAAGAREEPTHLAPAEFEEEAFGMLIFLCKLIWLHQQYILRLAANCPSNRTVLQDLKICSVWATAWKKPKQLGFLSCLIYLNVKVYGFVSQLACGAVLKLKEEALTHAPLQQIMFVFNTCHFENNLVMEENQHYFLTQQNVSILISDEKLMWPINSKHIPDFSFTCHVSCITSACISSLYQLSKESKINNISNESKTRHNPYLLELKRRCC